MPILVFQSSISAGQQSKGGASRLHVLVRKPYLAGGVGGVASIGQAGRLGLLQQQLVSANLVTD